VVQAWIKPVDCDQIVDGKEYFLARRPANSTQTYALIGTNIKGRRIITCKPGIADHFVGSESFRDFLRNNAGHAALEVPADAKTRWHRRLRRYTK